MSEVSSSTGCQPSRRSAMQRFVLGVAGTVGLIASGKAKDERGGAQPRLRPPLPLPAPPSFVDLTKEQMQSAWDDLASVGKAPTTVQLLATGNQTVSLLAEHMKPGTAPADPARINQLIEDLQSDRFATRQAAAMELEKLGPSVEPALRKVLDGHPPLEVSRRVETILARFPIIQFQFQNGLQTLMLHGSSEALALLATLSKGHSAAWQTQAAAATCERVRTANWNLLVYGPAQAQAEFEQQLLKQYWEDLKSGRRTPGEAGHGSGE